MLSDDLATFANVKVYITETVVPVLRWQSVSTSPKMAVRNKTPFLGKLFHLASYVHHIIVIEQGNRRG